GHDSHAWWWQCGACSSWNQVAAKKCKRCGMNKSWAQAANPGSGITASSGRGAGEPPPCPSHTAPPAAVSPMVAQDKASTRAKHVANVRHIEAALAALPDGDPAFASARATLQAQLNTEKKAITSTKSVAAQIEGCQQAILRSQARATKLQTTIDESVKELKSEDEHATSLKEEFASLEAQLAAGAAATPADSIQSATAALTGMIIDMMASPAVPPEHVQQAQNQVKVLLEGVQQIAAAARSMYSPAAAAALAQEDEIMGTSLTPAVRPRSSTESGAATGAAPTPANGRKPLRAKTASAEAPQYGHANLPDVSGDPAVDITLNTSKSATTQYLCVATAYVRTLNNGKHGEDCMTSAGVAALGRAQLLELQFASAGADIICIQEGCSPAAQVKSGIHYSMLIVAADVGQFGVQIWRKYDLKHKVIFAHEVSPRLAIQVATLANGATVSVLSAHAPIEAAPDPAKRSFWDSMGHRVSWLRFRWPSTYLIIGIDANARVGSVPTDCVGQCMPSVDNHNGSLLRQFLGEAGPGIRALNTFAGGDYTWRSAHQTTARIDYILSGADAPWEGAPPRVLDDVELATSACEDHRAVLATVAVAGAAGDIQPKPAMKLSVNRANLLDPKCVQAFQDSLWSAVPEVTGMPDADTKLEGAIQAVSNAATKAFGHAPTVPRQPWIIQRTWELLRPLPMLRRAMFDMKRLVNKQLMNYAWLAWRSLFSRSFMPADTQAQTMTATAQRTAQPHRPRAESVTFTSASLAESGAAALQGADGPTCAGTDAEKTRSTPAAGSRGSRSRSDQPDCAGWRARAEAAAVRRTAVKLHLAVQQRWQGLSEAHRAIRGMVMDDKRQLMHDMAWKAACANEHNDSKESCRIVRLLGGFKPQAIEAIANKDGSLVKTPAERADRWIEHFTELFAGYTLSSWKDAKTVHPGPYATGAFNPTLTEVDAKIQALGADKAQGPDGLPPGVIKAGGCPKAVHVHSIVHDMVVTRSWPARWKGGRMATPWKRKGSPKECNDHRGLLVADSMAKIPAGLLKDEIMPAAIEKLPETQFGGKPGGGTDFPPRALTLLTEFADAHSMFRRIIFFDLTQAFDRVIREIVYGWPPCSGHCWARDAARAGYLRQRALPIRAAAKVVPHIDKHGSVFERWNINPAVIALTQNLHDRAWFAVERGCKLGGLIFCCVCEEALAAMRSGLKTAGITLVLKTSKGAPFWTSAKQGDTVNLTAEVTYVDDEAVVIVARSSTQLRRAIGAVITLCANVFAEFGLRINWKKGKSETIVRCRGPGAAKVIEELRSEHGLRIPLDYGATAMRVVDGYQHLGGVISAGGSMVPEARQRASSAMSAYSPIAAKVFSSVVIGNAVKLHLLHSLVVSTLPCNVAIWTMSTAAPTQIHGPYMRALRRIADDVKAGHAPAFSDLAVRRRPQAPSIDCLVLRKRLRYYHRVVTHQPSAAWAFMQARPRGRPLPHVAQLIAELDLFRRIAPELDAMPGCTVAPGMWFSRMRFRCDSCDRNSPSNKALLKHKRIAHKQVAPIKAFTDDPGVCPACKTNFLERHRVIRRVTDRRRPACRNQITSTLPAQRPELAAEWEARDNERVRLARRAGSTHILAAGHAVTAA
ncbi:unnamed protein product, partial [Prorocentrum cordatum]